MDRFLLDRFLRLVDELEEAVRRLEPELDKMHEIVEHTRRYVASGADLRDLYGVSEAPAGRDALIDRLNDLHSALMRSRAEYIRLLVDEGAMTIPQVARLVGHPPQLVRRQYQAATMAAGGRSGDGVGELAPPREDRAWP